MNKKLKGQKMNKQEIQGLLDAYETNLHQLEKQVESYKFVISLIKTKLEVEEELN